MLKPGSATILSPSTRIVGDLTSEDEIVLSGTFEGTLRSSRNIQIANSGRLTGEVHADTVLVLGQVQGPIHAIDRIELQGGAVVNGDLSAQRVRIHDDVIFNGNCRITGAETARRQYLLPAMVQVFGTPAAAQELSRVANAAETFLNEFGFDVELRADRPADGAQTLRPIFRSRDALPFGRLRERLRGVEQALQSAAAPDAPKANRFGGFLKKTDAEAPLQTTGADGARALLDALAHLRNAAVMMGPVIVTRFEANHGNEVAVRARPECLSVDPSGTTPPDPSALLVSMQKVHTDVVRDLSTDPERASA